MFLIASPWTYLRDLKIDMGYSAGIWSDIFGLIRDVGIATAFVMAVISLVLHIYSFNGKKRAAHLESFSHRLLMMIIITGASVILSFIMVSLNRIFGIF